MGVPAIEGWGFMSVRLDGKEWKKGGNGKGNETEKTVHRPVRVRRSGRVGRGRSQRLRPSRRRTGLGRTLLGETGRVLSRGSAFSRTVLVSSGTVLVSGRAKAGENEEVRDAGPVLAAGMPWRSAESHGLARGGRRIPGERRAGGRRPSGGRWSVRRRRGPSGCTARRSISRRRVRSRRDRESRRCGGSTSWRACSFGSRRRVQ